MNWLRATTLQDVPVGATFRWRLRREGSEYAYYTGAHFAADGTLWGRKLAGDDAAAVGAQSFKLLDVLEYHVPEPPPPKMTGFKRIRV